MNRQTRGFKSEVPGARYHVSGTRIETLKQFVKIEHKERSKAS